MIGEIAVPIEQTTGNVLLPIIQREQILKRIEKLPEEQKQKIRDDRLIHKRDSLIATGSGNLKEGKIKFDVNLQTGISLADKDLNRALTLKYEFLRKKLHETGKSSFHYHE